MSVDTSMIEHDAALLERMAGDGSWPGPVICTRIAATLRALAAERDALLVEAKNAEEAHGGLAATLHAARAECVALASKLTEAQAQVARLRRGWLTTIQGENSCDGSGKPCDAKRCGCVEEMEMLLREHDERAALTEAPRHD
jgi:hypothetical protein